MAQSLQTLIVKAVTLIGSFAVGMATARLLGVSGRGTIAAFMAVPLMLMPLGEMGLRQSAAYLLGQRRSAAPILAQTLGGLSLINAIVWFVIALVCAQRLVPSHAVRLLPWLFAAMMPVMLFQSYYSGILLGRQQITQLNALGVAEKLAALAGLILLVGVWHFGLTGAAIALWLSQVVPALLLAYWLRRDLAVAPRCDWALTRELIQRGSLFALSLFVAQLNYRVDVVMLTRMQGLSSVGIYSVGVTVCELLKELPLAVGLVLFSRSTNLDPRRAHLSVGQLHRLLWLITGCVGAAALVLAVAAPWLIPLCYGASFAPSVRVIWWLLPGMVALSAFLVLQFFAAGQGKPHLTLWAFGPALIANVLLNLVLIPRWNYIGASISSTITYTMASILYAVRFLRVFHAPDQSAPELTTLEPTSTTRQARWNLGRWFQPVPRMSRQPSEAAP